MSTKGIHNLIPLAYKGHYCFSFWIQQLTGKKLDELSESKPQIDELFSRLQSICNDYVDLDPNLRFIVTRVLDMRASNWGEETSQCQQQQPPTEMPAVTEYSVSSQVSVKLSIYCAKNGYFVWGWNNNSFFYFTALSHRMTLSFSDLMVRSSVRRKPLFCTIVYLFLKIQKIMFGEQTIVF